MGRTFRVLGSALACLWLLGVYSATVSGVVPPVVEAPAGFDNQTNGFVDQAVFDGALLAFEERDTQAGGLGPVYNAQSCAECHQTPVIGGISQVTELRAGHFNGTAFVAHPGGSLINDRAVDAEIQEHVLPGNEVTTFRTSLNTLGDGFVEAIDDQTLINISTNQPAGMRGLVVHVPVLEAATGVTRVGRFGWKNQQASLLSFSSDAYLNEQGITNRFNLVENTSNGRNVAFPPYDLVPDNQPCTIAALGICGEDPEDEISQFATFMRSTKVPSRGPSTPDAVAGSAIFDAIGCNTCHVRSIVTAPEGTPINGGTMLVPAALAGKTIHPFGDFLLHNVGTGDGIVQNGGAATRNRMRTAPLWGVRTRSRLMHDGESRTVSDAIHRHGGEALGVTLKFAFLLNSTQRRQLVAFVGSL
jgi:CxxC motif-containing protein (DUF1111 family)